MGMGHNDGRYGDLCWSLPSHGGGGGLGHAVPRCRHIGCVVSHGAAAVSCRVVLCYMLCCVVLDSASLTFAL